MESPGARRVAVFLAATLAAAIAPAASAPAMTGAEIVQVINTERHANGLPAVREDPRLSAGCAQFDEYRRMNGSLEDAFTLPGEQPGRPGYSAAGARAGRDSLLNAGDRVADSFAAGDVFDDAPGHLVALMDPAVAVVGTDQTDFQLGLFGTVHLVCVDVRSAPRRVMPRRLHVYLYRGPYGRLPARHLAYREGPSGLGSLVALYFEVPAHEKLRLRSVGVRNGRGKTQPLTAVTASGGLVYAPRRGKAANHVGEFSTPSETATGRAPNTREEDPQMRQDREAQERRLEERFWGEHTPTFEDPEIVRLREAQERETNELQEKLMLPYDAERLGPPASLPNLISGSISLGP
jgi:hypothetical protein